MTADETKIELIEGEVARLDLRPGDRVVLTFPGRLSPDQIAHIQDAWKRCYPDVQALVAHEGVKIHVLRTEPPS